MSTSRNLFIIQRDLWSYFSTSWGFQLFLLDNVFKIYNKWESMLNAQVWFFSFCCLFSFIVNIIIFMLVCFKLSDKSYGFPAWYHQDIFAIQKKLLSLTFFKRIIKISFSAWLYGIRNDGCNAENYSAYWPCQHSKF